MISAFRYTPTAEQETQTYIQVRIALEHLNRVRLSCVVDVPMEDSSLGYEAEGRRADPLPEDDILVHGCRLKLLLLLQVEDLQCSRLRPQSDDLLRPVHDGTVGLDGSSDNIVPLLQVDDNNFRRRGTGLLFAYANERVGL
jgi:hypothetical protein